MVVPTALRAASRTTEGGAELAEHRLQLVVAREPVGGRELLAGAQREHQPEEALDHPLVDLAHERDPLVELASALVLAGGALDARRKRRKPSERQHRLALLLDELETAAPTVGEDHAQPAATGRNRRAGDGGDAGETGVAGWDFALEVLRCRHHAILGQRPLRDRSLVERSFELRYEALVDAVRADRANGAGRGVIQQQRKQRSMLVSRQSDSQTSSKNSPASVAASSSAIRPASTSTVSGWAVTESARGAIDSLYPIAAARLL